MSGSRLWGGRFAAGPAEAFWSEVRRYGITPGSEFSDAQLARHPGSVLIIVDDAKPPGVELLKAAKSAGIRVAFSSGGKTNVDAGIMKARLRAIRDAGLGWKDFWVPGKN